MLHRGQYVRLSNEHNREPFVAMVTLASGTSVMVMFEARAVYMPGGGMAATSVLPLTVDEGADTLTDLWGGVWRAEVQE